MKKILIIIAIFCFFLIGSRVDAQVYSPNYWKLLTNSVVRPIKDTWELYVAGTTTTKDLVASSTNSAIYKLTGTTGLEQQSGQSFWIAKYLDSVVPDTGLYFDAVTGKASFLFMNVASWWSNLQTGEMYSKGNIYASSSVLIDGNLEVKGYATSTDIFLTDNNDSVVGGHRVTKEHSGFADFTDSTITFDNSTRTFTISPNDGSYDYYLSGKKFSTTTSASVVIPATAGQLNYIYFDNDLSGNIVQSTSPWNFWDAQIATVYWDGSKALIGFDRHGITMDWATHKYLHNTVGTRYQSGLTGTYTNTAFSLTTGIIHDEDNIDDVPATTTTRLFYRTAGGYFTFTNATSSWYIKNGTEVQYDNGGTLTNMNNSYYSCSYVYATNDRSDPIYTFIGQAQYSSIANARTNCIPQNLAIGTLPTAEMKLLYIVILRNDATPYEETVDYRAVQNQGLSSGFTPTDHGTLSGLTDDDHTQYALLADTRGIQTFLGGLIFGNTTTTNATTTNNSYIGNLLTVAGGIVADTTTFVVDAVNDRVGIGTALPAYTLHIVKAMSGATTTADIFNSQATTGVDDIDEKAGLRFGLTGFGTEASAGAIVVGKDADYRTGAKTDSNMQFWNVLDGVDYLRMIIKSSGNVGIGTNNPQRLLHLENTGATSQLLIADSDSATNFKYGGLRFTNGDWILNTMTDALASTNRLYVASTTGNFGIANSNPNYLLTVGTGGFTADNSGNSTTTNLFVTNELVTGNSTAGFRMYNFTIPSGAYSGTILPLIYSNSYINPPGFTGNIGTAFDRGVVAFESEGGGVTNLPQVIFASRDFNNIATVAFSTTTEELKFSGALTYDFDNQVSAGAGGVSGSYALTVNGGSYNSGDSTVNGSSYVYTNLTVDDFVGIGTSAGTSVRLSVTDTADITYNPLSIASPLAIFYQSDPSGFASIRLQTQASGGSLQKQGAISVIDGDGANTRNSSMTFGLRDTATTVVNEKMRLDYNGQLGIGTTSPVTKLDVAGLMRATQSSTTTCSSLIEGAIFFNPTVGNKHAYVCNGTVWKQLDN